MKPPKGSDTLASGGGPMGQKRASPLIVSLVRRFLRHRRSDSFLDPKKANQGHLSRLISIHLSTVCQWQYKWYPSCHTSLPGAAWRTVQLAGAKECNRFLQVRSRHAPNYLNGKSQIPVQNLIPILSEKLLLYKACRTHFTCKCGRLIQQFKINRVHCPV